MKTSSIKKFYIKLGILVIIFCIGIVFTPFYFKVTNSSSNLSIQNTLFITQSAGNNSIIEDWPTFHGNFNRTGATETTPKEGNTPIWEFTTEGQVKSSPAISNGFVYIGSDDNKLYCIDAANGELVWYFTTKGSIQSSPTIANGFVYFGSNDSNFYCLNATTGMLLWNYTTDDKIYYNSAAVANGRVYFSSFDNNFYCLNGMTGMLLWKLNIANDSYNYPLCSSPAITNGHLYIGGSNKHLYCLNASQGTIIWDFNMNYSVYSTPVIKNGLLYIEDENLFCLNATTGIIKWYYSSPYFYFTSSTPTVANGYLYAACDMGKFHCFNATDGKMIWEYPMGEYIYTLSFPPQKTNFTSSSGLFSSPAIANGMVYIGSPNKNVYCLNATTGTLMWNYETGSGIDSSPAVHNGAVYIGSDDGNIYCLSMIMPYTQQKREVGGMNIGSIFIVSLLSIIVTTLYTKRHMRMM